jgi:cell division protein FtsL
LQRKYKQLDKFTGGERMSNLARKYQLEKKFEQQNNDQAQYLPKKEKQFWLTPGEKVLGVLFGLMVCFLAVQMISAQASLYEINKEIVSLDVAVGEQEKVNNDLRMLVSELSTYERIWEKARELGLKLNENNVKVVHEK